MGNGLIHIYNVESRLDSSNVEIFKSETAKLLNTGGVGIIIDFSETKFIDSIGLGALVSILKATVQNEMKIFLCSLSPEVKQIFELTRLYRLFDIFENLDEAKAEMEL